MSEPTRITLSVTTTDAEIIARTTEHFARAAAGLALEGVQSFMLAGPDDES